MSNEFFRKNVKPVIPNLQGAPKIWKIIVETRKYCNKGLTEPML